MRLLSSSPPWLQEKPLISKSRCPSALNLHESRFSQACGLGRLHQQVAETHPKGEAICMSGRSSALMWTGEILQQHSGSSSSSAQAAQGVRRPMQGRSLGPASACRV